MMKVRTRPSQESIERWETRKMPMYFVIDYSKFDKFCTEFDDSYKIYIYQTLKEKYDLEIEFSKDKKEYILQGNCSQSQIASAFTFIGYAMAQRDEGR